MSHPSQKARLHYGSLEPRVPGFDLNQRLETRDPKLLSIIIGGIEVRGTAEFLARTREALALLGPPRRLEFVQANIAVIQQARRSGMKAWLKRPTFTVGKATWQHSALWYAGAIAHDAYHSKLYQEAKNALSGATQIPLSSRFGKGGKREISPAANSWTGAEAEKKCLVFQLQVLRELDAGSEILSYVEQCANNPTYQGRNQGWRGWLAYRRRWW